MFQPSKELLQKYADILVNFALNSGEGIKKNDVVYIRFPDFAKDLGLAIYESVLKAGGNPIYKMTDEKFERSIFDLGNDSQIEYFPDKWTKSLIDTIDHQIAILGDEDPFYLKGVPAEKIILSNKNTKKIWKWRNKKEDAGKFTWTLALYGTPKMAEQAGISLEEYWTQIINACFLNAENPIEIYRETYRKLSETKDKLNSLDIEKLHVEGEKTDLWITMGEKRKFIGGSGRNIPSFELFTSPDWRGTNGKIHFDLPLYRYGNIIRDINLEFRDGIVVNFSAAENENLLKEMIQQKNANKIGEFSLTDRRFSKITKFMAETLFDENFGGEFGNTHLALGTSYHDTYDGDATKVKNSEWEKLGFNESTEHCDIIQTENRKVTAILKDGSEKVIYHNGQFQI